MKLLAKLRSYTRSLTDRSTVESDIEAELRSHIELRAADLKRTGLTAAEAHRRACIEFGTVETHKEGIRTSLGLRLFDEFRADLRFAARMLRRSPGFTSVAIVSLALGIGANTIIFTMAKAILLDRLDVPSPNDLRLFSIIAPRHSPVHSFWGSMSSLPGGGMVTTSFSYPIYEILRDQNRANPHPVLGDLIAFKDLGGDRGLTSSINGHSEVATAELVSGNFFQQLGVNVVLGRPIQPSDDAIPGAGAVAMISDGMWSRDFGRSPSVVGRIIQLNLVPVTIIGVTPAGFTGASSVQICPDVFLPFSIQPIVAPWSTSKESDGSLLTNKNLWWMQIMARRKPGVSDETARAALDVAMAQAIRATLPIKKDDQMPTLSISSGSRGLNSAGENFSKPIYVLGALTGFVLLLACANLANLLLARSTARQREMSVRLALGATRGRVLRQVLTESLLLSALGGVTGLALGYFGRNVIPHLLSTSWEPVPMNTHFDLRIFAFTAAVSLFTGILFGIIPAWQSTRTNVSTALKDSATAATRRRKGLLGKGLVSFQIALSSLLVVSAGLFAFSLSHLSNTGLGFRPEHLIMFEMQAPPTRYPSPQDVALHQRMEERLAQVPGVQLATLTAEPLVANSMSNTGFFPEGQPARTGDDSLAMENEVGQHFFETYSIPILYGRTFTSADTPHSSKVAVINEALAKRNFPHANPVGKTFHYGETDGDIYQIIGVSANAKYANLRDAPTATVYVLSRQQKEESEMTYVVRTNLGLAAILPSLRSAAREVDKDIPLRNPRTQIEQINATIMQERLFATLTSAFGLLALILAAIGIYGIMAYTVSRRTSEIGVRMALGARPQQVRLMVLRESGWMAIVGIAVGIGASIGLARLVRAMLYGLTPNDPTTLIGTTCLLFLIALTAAYGPARRASRIDPMQALRHE
jgi:predicted permease